MRSIVGTGPTSNVKEPYGPQQPSGAMKVVLAGPKLPSPAAWLT